MSQAIRIREAKEEDFPFVAQLMDDALGPFYGGDHRAHAARIFSTHISGGEDPVGYFSLEQKMFIMTLDGEPAGMIHLVAKRQGTVKISPIIVVRQYRGKYGLGTRLLEVAEEYARQKNARQLYCTVSENNNGALQFFARKGFIVAGRADSQYKRGVREIALYKPLTGPSYYEELDRPHVSVRPCREEHEQQVRQLLLSTLPGHFQGIDWTWVDALFAGYRRRRNDVQLKYKLIYVAIDRKDTVLGVAAATPKKGEPINVKPLVALAMPAFVALITDIPHLLRRYGRKVYIHIVPSIEETIALQRRGWNLDTVMPTAYHSDHITQQWSFDVSREDFVRSMRTKPEYLDFIRDGRKTLEVRVGYDDIRTIQRGERIKFATQESTMIARVRDVREYQTIDDIWEHEEPSRIIPDATETEALMILREIYPPKLERLGMIVIEIRPEY